MDWSFATIPLKKGTFKLELEAKSRFTMVRSQDPQAQVLYQDTSPSTYPMVSEVTEDNQKFALSKTTLYEESKVWMMQFNDSCSTSSSRAGVVIISLEGHICPFAYGLQFECTNNTAEYEALLLGLKNAKDMGIKLLKVEGDAELIVKQIKDHFYVRNQRLQSYRQRVWNVIGWFDAFNIIYIPRSDNSRVDALAVSAALFMPHSDFRQNTFAIELINKPIVPDNAKN